MVIGVVNGRCFRRLGVSQAPRECAAIFPDAVAVNTYHIDFHWHLNEIRLERSLHFLRDLRYNVTDVACLCGFADLQYFIRWFRERFGFTPGEYRKRQED